MPPFAEFFGSLERLLGELYPYRVPLGLLALVLAGGALLFVRRRGLDAALAGWARAHPAAAAVGGITALAVALPLGYYTLSPLWIRTALNEPSPLEAAAVATRVATPVPTASVTSTTPPAPPTPASPAPPAGEPSTPAPTAPAAGQPTTPTASAPTPPPAVPPSPVATSVASPVAPPSATPTPPAATPRVLRRGALAGADAFHFGRGDVLLIESPDGKRILRFEGLSVRNGPDLFVYLTPQAESVAQAVNLGTLKATDGSFNYEVPATVDAAALANAIIWCRQFGVLFASAPLTPAS